MNNAVPTKPRRANIEPPQLDPKLEIPVRLEAVVEPRAEGGVVVRLRFHNDSGLAVYVYDQLWRFQGATIVKDVEGAYRFAHNGALRLLLGPAPLPHDTLVDTRIIPHVTEVQPDEPFEREIVLPAVVDEHSVYFGAAKVPEGKEEKDVFDRVDVEKIEVFVSYLAHQDTLTRRPGVDGAIDFQFPIHVAAAAKLARASVPVTGLVVRRRKGSFSRFTAPKEPLEPHG